MIYDSSEQVSFFQALFCESKATIRKKKVQNKKKDKETAAVIWESGRGASSIYDPITARFIIIAKFAITESRL